MASINMEIEIDTIFDTIVSKKEYHNTSSKATNHIESIVTSDKVYGIEYKVFLEV